MVFLLSPENLTPKLSDFVDAHRVPMGSAVRMGRRNFFAGRRNGSRAAQILTESPGGQCPTTETADAACEEVLENRRRRSLSVFCGGPCGRQTPSGPSAETKIRIAQLRSHSHFNFRPILSSIMSFAA